MKILVSVKNVTISIDSEANENLAEGIRLVLTALAWVIRGVDKGEQWPQFDELVKVNAMILKKELQEALK